VCSSGTFRLYNCRRCFDQVRICSPCDRGHQYCKPCAPLARTESRRRAEAWPVGTIARHLRVHHSAVRRVLTQAGVPISKIAQRPGIADAFLPFIRETLEQYPRLCASRLYTMVRARGCRGGPDHFRAIVARHRPARPTEAYLRLRTLPGEQAQVDWAHFGQLTLGKATRSLMAFVMVLSYSRSIFLRF
jgi:hypothetical protein